MRQVTVEKDRVCLHCGRLIPKGTKCGTLSSFSRKREWVCKRCLSSFNELINSINECSGVGYDDEGYSQFCIDDISEASSEWSSIGRDGDDTLNRYIRRRLEDLGLGSSL